MSDPNAKEATPPASDAAVPAGDQSLPNLAQCIFNLVTSGPTERDAIRAITAEMRRFMPNACGDWADKIDAALNAEREDQATRDRRMYEQGRRDEREGEPEAFV